MARKPRVKTNSKMRRTVLGTLSGIFMVSALIVAAIPSSKSEAAGEAELVYENLNYYSQSFKLDPASTTDKARIIERQGQFETKKVDDIMPIYQNDNHKQSTPVFFSEDGLFSVAYARMREQATNTGVIVNFDITNPNVSSTLDIPQKILAYQYDNNGNGTNLQAVCGDAVGYEGTAGDARNYLYYVAQEETVTGGVSENAVEVTKYTMEPCYATYKNRWFQADEQGNNSVTMYQRDDNVTSGLGVIQAEDGHYYKPSQLIGGQLSVDIQYIGSDRYNPNTKQYDPDTGVFQNATQISTLKIGSNILAIGNNAFVNCQFNTVNLGNKIQQIGDYAFYNCNMLRNLNLYDESDKDASAIHATTALNVIGACAFSGCTSLSSVVMPDQVQSIGMFCFANDSGLVSANLYGIEQDGNTSLTKLGDGLFMNCTSLEVLHIADGVNNIDSVEYMLYDCISLYELYLPNNGGGIVYLPPLSGNSHSGVFAANNVTGCNNLRTVKIPYNTIKVECGSGSEDKYNDHIDAPAYPYPVTNPTDIDAFGRANLGCHVSHPEDYQVSSAFVILGNRSESSNAYKYARAHGLAFGYTEEGVEYYEKFSENYFYTIVKPTDGTSQAALSKISIESGSGENIIIPSTIGPYTIGSIASEAFVALDDKLPNIKYVNIPYTIKSIGSNTFTGCTGLEAVHFDNAMAVNSIDSQAFYTGADANSPGLKFIGEVSKDGVESVPYQYAMTVGNTYNDPEASEPKYITFCTDFPSNQQIRLQFERSDVDHSMLNPTPTLISVPKGVQAYKIGNTVPQINDYSLTPYEKDKTAQNELVTSTLRKYANGTPFESLTQAEQNIVIATTVLDVPYGVRAIGKQTDDGEPVLAGNKDLITIQFQSIEHIQDKALDGLEKLVNFTMLSSGNGEGESMGSYVFENCPSLQTVSLPTTFTKFGTAPFHGATDLTHVDFNLGPNFTCENQIIYGLDEVGNHVSIVECLRTRGNKQGSTSYVTSNEFANVSTIQDYAFYDCDGIVTADMSGSGVVKIPANCFDSCVNLYECTLPDATTEIESCAFKDTKIRKILIPNTFAHISDTAFVDSVGGVVSGNTGGDVSVRDVDNLIIQGYSPSTAENYANSALHPTFTFEKINAKYSVTFLDYDDTVLYATQIAEGNYIPQVTWSPPTHEGMLWEGWDPADYYDHPVNSNMTIKAVYSASATATYTLTYVDYDDSVLFKETVMRDGYAKGPDFTPTRDLYVWIGWDPSNYNAIPITKDLTVRAQYRYTGIHNGSGSTNPDDEELSGSDTNANTSGSNSGKNTSSSSGKKPSSSSDKNTSSNNSGASTNGGNQSTTTNTNNNTTTNSKRPSVSGNSGSVNNNNNSNKTSGGTKVDVTKTGISNSGLVSATVNGGNGDNYVVKITDSESARSAVNQALATEYGSLDSIKYFAMDISLYDSTGTTKLENVAGISVNITMPIPDALVSYGGNNKAGAVSASNTLEKLATRFTTIDGVPCISFTATHFSPYTIYVDTNNLSATGMIDETPKTADPIEPKWFLAIGLALLSVITFLMRGSKRKIIKVV